MKACKSILFLSCLLISFTIQAQSIVGNWSMEVPTPEGTLVVDLEIKADNTYAVDLGGDGTVDVNGTYSVEGDQMTIKDTDGPEACPQEAVYKVTVSDTEMVMNRVSDPCEGRGGPEGVMTFARQ